MKTGNVGKIALVVFSILASFVLPAQAANPNCAEVDGDYIVSFPRGTSIANEVRNAPGRPISMTFTFDIVLNGFAATLTAEQACAFKKRPGASVNLDGVAYASTTRTAFSWGQDRIDELSLGETDGKINSDSNGSGVNAYIVDTGIYSKHSEFTGRLQRGYSVVGGGTEDCNGHGTHVAGTVGGTKYGVANGVKLIPVRVLKCDGSGSWSGIIAGLDWIGRTNSGPAVANMSLGGGAYAPVDEAVRNLVGKKVVVVVAAGNLSQDVSTFSPAREPSAITVGATTSTDAVAAYSNFGSGVDLYAPGSSIISAGLRNSSATATMSGTSMASPHVAGVVARYLQRNPSSDPSAVATAVNGATNLFGSPSLKMACLTSGECGKN